MSQGHSSGLRISPSNESHVLVQPNSNNNTDAIAVSPIGSQQTPPYGAVVVDQAEEVQQPTPIQQQHQQQPQDPMLLEEDEESDSESTEHDNDDGVVLDDDWGGGGGDDPEDLEQALAAEVALERSDASYSNLSSDVQQGPAVVAGGRLGRIKAAIASDDPQTARVHAHTQETVAEMLLTMIRNRGKQTDKATGDWLKYMATKLLPQPNLCPSSFHQVKKAVDVRELWEMEYHACRFCLSGWWRPANPNMHAALAAEPADCTCQKCGQQGRFIVNGEKVEPAVVSAGRVRACVHNSQLTVGRAHCHACAQPFYYLGLQHILRELLMDPDLVEKLGRSRNMRNVNEWWGSRDCKALIRLLGEQLMQPAPAGSPLAHHTLTGEIAFDFGQMYDFTNEGMGILAFR